MRIGLAGVGRIGAFHAQTLRDLDGVDALVLADTVPGRAAERAAALGVQAAPEATTLLDQGLDAMVITTPTNVHADLLRAAVAAGTPVFCEKPVAGTLGETVELAELENATEVPIQIGFQRRFDEGYRRARQAVADRQLGVLHSIRMNTHDQAPPAPDYLPSSGGLFRDCSIHDFDALRFVTGREVVQVQAVGANKGADFFAAADDVATAAALLTLDDETLVVVTATRYNGGGHDVRMELHGAEGALAVGLDDSLPFTSAEPGVSFPPGPRKWSFMERFQPAYRKELAAFVEVAAGRIPSPCTISDGLEAFRIAEACEISRREGRTVALTELEHSTAPAG